LLVVVLFVDDGAIALMVLALVVVDVLLLAGTNLFVVLVFVVTEVFEV